MRMKRRQIIRTLYAYALLLVMLSAYTAKSLHTHSPEYYASFQQTQHEDPSPDLTDDCPLCNFHFFSYTTTTEWLLISDFRLITPIYQPDIYAANLIPHRELSLRAPPVWVK